MDLGPTFGNPLEELTGPTPGRGAGDFSDTGYNPGKESRLAVVARGPHRLPKVGGCVWPG